MSQAINITASGNIGLGMHAESPSYPIEHANGASLSVGGVWTDASSRDLKTDIKPLLTRDALLALNKLQPVTYKYKSEQNEQYVGFIAEDVPELVAMNDRKRLSPMDIASTLVAVVKYQQKEIQYLKSQIEVMKK